LRWSFICDRRGNILPLFGLALVPIVGLIGAAVDYSRASSVQSKLQAALDSTVLAMAPSAPSLSAAQLQAAASAYFFALYKATSASSVTTKATASTLSKRTPELRAAGGASAPCSRRVHAPVRTAAPTARAHPWVSAPDGHSTSSITSSVRPGSSRCMS
jgi:Flp pilus assembly protein TadG